jgi:hypothetical protein
MGKLGLFLLPLIFIGCEKTFDTIIDSTRNNHQVISVIHADNPDLKNPADSLFTVRIRFTSGSQIRQVFFSIVSSDNTILNPALVEMFDSGNSFYSGQVILKSEYPNGNYTINYTAIGLDGESKPVATSHFSFNNGQDNVPPVISNTVIEPDTAVVTSATVISTSVEAADSNGQSDIQSVYFVVYRPDGSTNEMRNLLFDDGNVMDHGDLVAGDGIYSLLIQVDGTNQKGTYRFEFQAVDRSGETSNTIDHFVLIQ